MLKRVPIVLVTLLVLGVMLVGPVQAQEPSGDFEVVRMRIEEWLASEPKPVVTVDEVYENLNDGDTSNDPFILDVRKVEDYAAGHIPGAVYVDPKAVFTADNLAAIPADKPVVVYCYTGQTASQVTPVLNMLGYDASNLKFGFASWSPTGKYPFNAATDSMNYRFEGTGQAAAPAIANEAPANLPQSGGIPFDFTWVYILLGSGLLGSGLYLRRR